MTVPSEINDFSFCRSLPKGARGVAEFPPHIHTKRGLATIQVGERINSWVKQIRLNALGVVRGYTHACCVRYANRGGAKLGQCDLGSRRNQRSLRHGASIRRTICWANSSQTAFAGFCFHGPPLIAMYCAMSRRCVLVSTTWGS